MGGKGRPEEVTRARIAFSKPSGKSDVVRSRRSARRRVYVFAPPRRAGKARATHHVDERGRDVRQGLARARIGRPRRGVGERSRIRGACVRSEEVGRASVRILKTSARGNVAMARFELKRDAPRAFVPAATPDARRACIPVTGSMFSFSSSYRRTDPTSAPLTRREGFRPSPADATSRSVRTPHRRAMCIASSVTGEGHFRGSEAHAAASRAAGVAACICFTAIVRKRLCVSPRARRVARGFFVVRRSAAKKKLQKTVTDGCARLCAHGIRDCSKSRLAWSLKPARTDFRVRRVRTRSKRSVDF